MFTGIQWGDITVGVAAIIGLVYVARCMRGSNKDTLEFLGNHLSAQTDALVNLTAATTRLVDHVAALGAELEAHRIATQADARQVHDDILQVAAVLKKVDVDRTRKKKA